MLLGKQHQVRLALCCLIAGGHLLIEDRPGMGKSTLAESLARSCELAFKRVSFTSDLLPADLTGLTVFDPATASFRFQPGPIFTQVLLADEINRASPRTQSALLEAMAAGRVSVDGTSHPLPQPFFVIATQNSLDQVGTSPLPEAQLDRFLMRLSLGYPDRAAERDLLMGKTVPTEQMVSTLESVQLIDWQQRCSQQHCSQNLIDYVLDLVRPHVSAVLVCHREPVRDYWPRRRPGRCSRSVPTSRWTTFKSSALQWLSTVSIAGSHQGLMAVPH